EQSQVRLVLGRVSDYRGHNLNPSVLAGVSGHEDTKPRRRFLFMRIWIGGAVVCTIVSAVAVRAQDHTVIALSHSNHTVYELDPATGKVLHELVAPDQPHEAAVTSDGSTIFASIPAAGFVEIIDAATFKEKGRIDS